MELDNAASEKVITNCKDMNGWIKFLGIAYIVSGGLTALTLFGIIIAWLPIWMGVILLRGATSTREVATGKLESLVEMSSSIKTFFIISGVTMIISIVFSAIWFMIVGIAFIGGLLGETGGVY